MDKIAKALSKLIPKEREQIKVILEKLKSNKTSGLDIKKLKDRNEIFRVRSGKLRVIYKKDQSGISLLAIERRNDTTYKKS
ncbi:MAG: hypothetical protein WD883_03245 [Candidatus Colwellbacteria bacterium]